MLILVGVTINVALNGGLFGTTEWAADQTKIEAEKEQLLAAVLAAVGTNGEVDFNKVVLPKDFTGSAGVYKSKKSGTTYTVDKKTLYIEDDQKKDSSGQGGSEEETETKNKYGYYDNYLYGSAHINQKDKYNTEDLEYIENNFKASNYGKIVTGSISGSIGSEAIKNCTLEDCDMAGEKTELFNIYFLQDSLVYIDASESEVSKNEIPIVKDETNKKIYWKIQAGEEEIQVPIFFSEDGKTIYFIMIGN